MRKKLLALLLCICLAFSTGTVVSSFAGIVKSDPAGEGMVVAGSLNKTNFKISDDKNPSAYQTKSGNKTWSMNAPGWRDGHFGPTTKIDGSKVALDTTIAFSFNVYDFGDRGGTDQQLYFDCFSNGFGTAQNYIGIFPNASKTVDRTKICFASNIYQRTQRGDYPYGEAGGIYFGEAMDVCEEVESSEGTLKAGFSDTGLDGIKSQFGSSYMTYWLEWTVTKVPGDELGRADLQTYYGYVDAEGNVQERIKSVFVKDAAFFNKSDIYYVQMAGDGVFEIDDVKITMKQATGEPETLFETDFEDASVRIINYTGADEQAGKWYDNNKGMKLRSAYSYITATNPNVNSRITTLKLMNVDNRLAKTFEMTATFKLQELTSAGKVGIMFGLTDSYDKPNAPKNGASMIYLTAGANDSIVLGAVNVATDGTITPVGSTAPINGVKVGDDTYFSLNIEGVAGNGVTPKVKVSSANLSSSIEFEGLSVNGAVAFTQLGTGSMTYTINTNEDAFSLIGYKLSNNDADATAISSSFDNNYISAYKYSVQNTIATEDQVISTGTSHALTGVTAENGKVGFYGTSTNTRLMTNKKYSDFVMQFDYISVPQKDRGTPAGLSSGLGTNRYSPLFIIFGAADAPIQDLLTSYALGIVEGNPCQYFWGAESLINADAKFANEGFAGATVCSELEETANTEDPNAIQYYYKDVGTNQIKTKYGVPKTDTEGYRGISFYNKTTRFKLVVINNNVALYAANITNNVVGEYIRVFEAVVSDSTGYVGLGTDVPAWCEIDNFAVTPISEAVAVEKGLNAVPSVDLVADVTTFDTDPIPTRLAAPKPVYNEANNKITWSAVQNASSYEITVKLGDEVEMEKVVEAGSALELDLSKLTKAGEYVITVKAIPSDIETYAASLNGTVKVTLKGSSNSNGGGCGGSVALSSIALSASVFAVAGALAIKRKKSK